MGLFTNVGGQLKELSSLTTTVGGELKEINSLTANIGGQPKEIFTLFPKNISGTHHLTSGVSNQNNYTVVKNNIKIKTPVVCTMTATITDGYVYKQLSDGKYQIHNVNIALRYKKSNGAYEYVMDTGTIDWVGIHSSSNTGLVYTKTQTIQADNLHNMEIAVSRCVAKATRAMNSYDIESYYDNNLLSFDYSITFIKA